MKDRCLRCGHGLDIHEIIPLPRRGAFWSVCKRCLMETTVEERFPLCHIVEVDSSQVWKGMRALGVER